MAENVTRTSPETGSSPALGSDHPLTVLRVEVDRLFDSFFPPAFGRSIDFDRYDRACDITPSVEVKECGKRYEIAAELPGLDEQEKKIKVTGQ